MPCRPQNTKNPWTRNRLAKDIEISQHVTAKVECGLDRIGATHDVNEDGGKDGAGDGFAIGRVINASDELFVAGAVEETKAGEDDDCEEGEDGAVGPREKNVSESTKTSFSSLLLSRDGTGAEV